MWCKRMENIEASLFAPGGDAGLTSGDSGSRKPLVKMESPDQPFIDVNPPDFDPTEEFKGQDLLRSDTPETILTEIPSRPDITIQCEKCGMYIALRQLRDHRLYHKALSTLRYKGDSRPASVEGLLRRRNAILKKLKLNATLETPVLPKQIQKLNEAYEYLKTDLDGSFEEYRQIRDDVNTDVTGVSLNCSPSCVCAIGISTSANERWKSYMEDTRVYQDSFGDDQDKCYMAIFDGHHGRFAAEVAASELHRLLLNEMAKFDPKTKSTAVFNMADTNDISQYQFDRPETKQSDRDKANMHQESVDIVQQIIALCEEKYEVLMKKKAELPGNLTSEVLENLESERDSPTKKKKFLKNPLSLKIEQAFKKTYYLLDILLSYGKDECSRVRWSGSSALTVIIQNTEKKEEQSDWIVSPVPLDYDGETNKENIDGRESTLSASTAVEAPKELGLIHVANAGNVHAVLVRGNRAYRLSKDHSANNPKEKKRVLKAGGNLSESTKECRVNGVLATTRGIGNHGDQKLKRCVLVEPHTVTIPVDQYAQFLILASNGVWEVFSEQEAALLLLKLLPSNYIRAPSKVSTSLGPLLEECSSLANSVQVAASGARKVSFTSTDNSASPTKTDKYSEGGQEDADNKGQRSPLTVVEEEQDHADEKGRDSSEKISEEIEEVNEIKEEVQNEDIESSPSTISKRGVGRRTGKRNVDVDLQTEIGSEAGDSDDESGNEADIDSDLTSIPNMSRISNYGGPTTRDHLQREFAKTMSEHLVQAALLAGAKDNITVMVVLLPGCGL